MSGSPAWIRTTIHSFQSQDHQSRERRRRSWTTGSYSRRYTTTDLIAAPILRICLRKATFACCVFKDIHWKQIAKIKIVGVHGDPFGIWTVVALWENWSVTLSVRGRKNQCVAHAAGPHSAASFVLATQADGRERPAHHA
jgi:hypothetical protein